MRGKEIYKKYEELFNSEALPHISKHILIEKIEDFRKHLLLQLAKQPKKQEPYVTLNFYHHHVQFDNVYELMRAYKTNKLSLDEVLELCHLDSDEPAYILVIKTIKDNYESIEPYTKEDVIEIFDEEQLDLLGFPF